MTRPPAIAVRAANMPGILLARRPWQTRTTAWWRFWINGASVTVVRHPFGEFDLACELAASQRSVRVASSLQPGQVCSRWTARPNRPQERAGGVAGSGRGPTKGHVARVVTHSGHAPPHLPPQPRASRPRRSRSVATRERGGRHVTRGASLLHPTEGRVARARRTRIGDHPLNVRCRRARVSCLGPTGCLDARDAAGRQMAEGRGDERTSAGRRGGTSREHMGHAPWRSNPA